MEILNATQITPLPWWYPKMLDLSTRIFGRDDPAMIEQELRAHSVFHVAVAIHEQQVVGFKVGYQDRMSRFYSWLGGVDPDFRRRGIASALMQAQHTWCQERGYRLIRTQTKNTWREMLLLNIQSGFDVIGTYTDEDGQPKIILEKRLGG